MRPDPGAGEKQNYGDSLLFSRSRPRCRMARLARLVVPGIPHLVTQRGNRRETTFFRDADYRLYRELLGAAAAKAGAAIWAYCLMPNHVHVIIVPPDEDGLRRTF